jgi:hypothetical protein
MSQGQEHGILGIPGESGSRFNDTQWRSAQLSLGKTQLELMGIREVTEPKSDGRRILISNSFIAGCYQGTEVVAVLPNPDGDIYLGSMSIQTLTPDECALVLPLVDGLGQYYAHRGIIADVNQIIEVNPAALGEYVSGYPDNDPLAALCHNGRCNRINELLGESMVYIAPFPSMESQLHAKVLGFHHPQPGYAAQVNNKALFRELGRKYGIPIPDGCAIITDADIKIALDILGTSKSGWMKLDRGSGGDLVVKLEAPVTTNTIVVAIRKLRNSFEKALVHNRWNHAVVEEYWPVDSLLPIAGVITIEEDIRPADVDAGCLLMNSYDGSFYVPSCFAKLMTAQGRYIGGSSYYPPQPVMDLLIEYLHRIREMLATEFGLFGFVGVDFVVGHNDDGSPRITFYELNGRTPISGISYLLARKLGYRYWNNVNLIFPILIESYSDIERVIGDLVSSPPLNRIIPQALRTTCRIERGGERRVLVPSTRAKFFIGGDSPEECTEMLQLLMDRGIKVG